MKFWDTSAVVSVCVNEPASSTVNFHQRSVDGRLVGNEDRMRLGLHAAVS